MLALVDGKGLYDAEPVRLKKTRVLPGSLLNHEVKLLDYVFQRRKAQRSGSSRGVERSVRERK